MRRIEEAVQCFSTDGQHYRMQAVFFVAEFTGETPGKGEHKLCWVDVNE